MATTNSVIWTDGAQRVVKRLDNESTEVTYVVERNVPDAMAVAAWQAWSVAIENRSPLWAVLTKLESEIKRV